MRIHNNRITTHMIKQIYECTLLSDVILNQTSATEGEMESLDFIPGNTFLGIAAGALYGELKPQEAATVFHSGKVRFGDAHPWKDGIRSLKVPAALFYNKLGSPEEGCVIQYKWRESPDVQLKQCRNGFYIFDKGNHTGEQIKVRKSVAIKSAYDRNLRRSKDEQMFAYESLRKGARFVFEVEFTDDVKDYSDKVKSALTGTKHIGRSRTAQYGLVTIEEISKLTENTSNPAYEDGFATVYADGRLIFLDEKNGMPTFRPTAQMLGFGDSASINWEKTQIRTFQYAPWNSKRQNRDTDRCGIEKGSVIVVDLNGETSPCESRYVGSYINEGFGKVIYNPDFLKTSGDSGEALFKLSDGNNTATNITTVECTFNSSLISYAKKCKEADDISSRSNQYAIVNKFVRNNASIFTRSNEKFASQWGYIRTLAENAADCIKFSISVIDYVTHGVAKDKWEYKKSILLEFIQSISANKSWKEIMVNLAAEMAKKCKQ